MSDKRLKALETEIAYLRKEIEKFITVKPVEIHYHYYYNPEDIKHLLNYFKNQFGKHK